MYCKALNSGRSLCSAARRVMSAMLSLPCLHIMLDNDSNCDTVALHMVFISPRHLTLLPSHMCLVVVRIRTFLTTSAKIATNSGVFHRD